MLVKDDEDDGSSVASVDPPVMRGKRRGPGKRSRHSDMPSTTASSYTSSDSTVISQSNLSDALRQARTFNCKSD